MDGPEVEAEDDWKRAEKANALVSEVSSVCNIITCSVCSAAGVMYVNCGK